MPRTGCPPSYRFHKARACAVVTVQAKNFESICDEVRRGGDMPDVPLIVLTGMGIDPFRAVFATDASQRKLNDVKCAINQSIAKSVPHGEHRALEDAAHATFHVDRPDAVVQAVRDVLDRLRQ